MGPLVRLVSLLLVLGTWFALSDANSRFSTADTQTTARADAVSTR
jgi:hypothetical protein